MKKYFIPLQGDSYKGFVEEEGGSVSIWDAFQTPGPVDFIESHNDQFRIAYNAEDSRLPIGSDMDISFSPVIILSDTLRAEACYLSGFEYLKKLTLQLPNPYLTAYYLDLVIDNAFNKDKSEYDEYNNGYVIFKHALYREALNDSDIFRLRESPNKIFLSSSFVKLFKLRGFKGITFKEVETH